MNWTYFLPCLWAFLACAGFCVIFHVHTGVVICCLGGALGWLVYLLVALSGCSDLLCYFLAAIAISVYSEVMARVRKCPVTGYLLISCFPLVPGAGIYYTMEYAIRGDTAQFLEQGLHTLGIACCLAVGVLVVSSAVRMATTFRVRRRER
jgi:uncharacterized membrane protein YjjB (DUF3815 family)